MLAGCPLRGLLFKLNQPLLNTQAAIDHKANFSFKAADVAAGLVQLALRLINVVTSGVMRLANGFQVSFNVAQICHAGFKVVAGFFKVCFNFGLVSTGIHPL